MIESTSWRHAVSVLLILIVGCASDKKKPPTADKRPLLFDVRTFGATGGGTKLDTPAINKAIEAAHRAGGGTVLLHSAPEQRRAVPGSGRDHSRRRQPAGAWRARL